MKTLLALVTILTCSLGYLTFRARVRHHAVTSLIDSQAAVYFHHQFTANGFKSNSPTPTPKWFQDTFAEEIFRSVHSVRNVHSDALLRHVNPFTRLENLWPQGAGITDAGMAYLR
ncbi:MAG: hypothetical protein AAF961_12795, partial [Planctomycetota bacterium]